MQPIRQIAKQSSLLRTGRNPHPASLIGGSGLEVRLWEGETPIALAAYSGRVTVNAEVTKQC